MKMLTLPIVATIEACSGVTCYGWKHLIAFVVILIGVGSIISPYKAALLFVFGPQMNRALFSNIRIIDNVWTRVSLKLFFASCVLAVAVNLAQYTAIRLLGPGIYAALGQVKTSALVVLGSMVFQGRVTPFQIMGTGMAMSAVWWLAWLERSGKPVTGEIGLTEVEEVLPTHLQDETQFDSDMNLDIGSMASLKHK